MAKKYAVDNIFDKNGLLLISKGMEISDENLIRLEKLGLNNEDLYKKIMDKNNTEQSSIGELESNHLGDVISAFQDKVKAFDSKTFSYCNELLTNLVFQRDTSWRSYVVGLANYVDWVYTHSINVALLTLMIAKEYGIKDEDLYMLGLSAFLHDVGYLLIPKSIFESANEIDTTNKLIVQQHCELGKAMLVDIPDKHICSSIALQHHERLDGSGYPNRLKNEEICLYAKIVMIADSFDAMTSDRPYKSAVSVDSAIYMLQSDTKKYDKDLLPFLSQVFK